MTIATQATQVSGAAVLAALDTVRDPELDEPVTSLKFVASTTLSADGVVEVHLRLPTFFCAPNFAYLMVADAHDALSRVAGVSRAVVVLDDHFASDTINAGVASRAGFVSSFPGQAVDELDTLRATFLRKALLAGTDLVCRPLFAAGSRPEDLVGVTLGELEQTPALDRLRSRRAELGLSHDDDAPLVIDVVTGDPVLRGDMALHLGRARVTRVGMDANSGICRGLLQERYGDSARPTAVSSAGMEI